MKLINSLLLISLTLLLFGAKDRESIKFNQTFQAESSDYFMKAKINGKLIEFSQDSELSANFGPFIDNIYDGVIIGSNLESAENSVLSSITITIRKSGKIGVGSYSGGSLFQYGFKGVSLGYMDGNSMAMYVTNINNPESFLKISELSDTHIEGTFSGEVINIMDKSKISITDGEFRVKITSN